MSEAKARILIVDDQPSEVKMVKMALETAGYHVIYAYNGKEGLEKAVSEHPDLIILDIMMPEKDGFVACGDLKSSPATASIPVIVLTTSQSHTGNSVPLRTSSTAARNVPRSSVAIPAGSTLSR